MLIFLLSAQRPTAKELLKHKFITRYTKKTAYLTELIDRYRRWKSEGHGEESSSDDSDMWALETCVHTPHALTYITVLFQGSSFWFMTRFHHFSSRPLSGTLMVTWTRVPCGLSLQSDPHRWTSYRRATHIQIQRWDSHTHTQSLESPRCFCLDQRCLVCFYRSSQEIRWKDNPSHSACLLW